MTLHQDVLSPKSLTQAARFYYKNLAILESRDSIGVGIHASNGAAVFFNEPKFVESCLGLERLLLESYFSADFYSFVSTLTGVALLMGDKTICGGAGAKAGVAFVEMLLNRLGFAYSPEWEDVQRRSAFRAALEHNLQQRDGPPAVNLVMRVFEAPSPEIHRLYIS